MLGRIVVDAGGFQGLLRKYSQVHGLGLSCDHGLD